MQAPKLKPLPRSLVRDQTADAIRTLLLSGALAPGAAIKEQDLADQLGVSRNPVREALVRLESEGLLEFYRPQHGHRVLSPTRIFLRDLYDVRALLEGRSAELATARGNTPVDQLRSLASQMREAYDRRDPVRLARLDMDFHEIIVSASGNALLFDAWWRARNLMLFVTNFTVKAIYENVFGIDAAHVRLIEPIENGDAARAGELSRSHVSHFFEIYERLSADSYAVDSTANTTTVGE